MSQTTLYTFFKAPEIFASTAGPCFNNPFDKLPIETVQNIALHIETDQDVCSFRQACHSTYDSIDGDHGFFWRKRFSLVYDTPTISARGNKNLKEIYQTRREVLKKTNMSTFDIGEKLFERASLEIIKDLIKEAFSGKSATTAGVTFESYNLQHIQSFILSNNLLNDVNKPATRALKRRRNGQNTTPSRLLQTIQVLLAPEFLSLNGHMLADHYCFPMSQMAAYGSKDTHPIFMGCNNLDINMDFVINNLNFWKYHMVRQQEYTLYPAFKALAEHDRPQFWSEQLKQGVPTLGKKWKGSYSFVERGEIKDIRAGYGQDGQIADQFNGEVEVGAFQDLQLKLVDSNPDEWPHFFEQILGSDIVYTNRAKTRAQHRSAAADESISSEQLTYSFEGTGFDHYEDFSATGKLNILPPQEGVPGWQRLTMMKYFIDPVTGLVDYNALWAYEGVVLPGGKIILGRWWSPDDGTGEEMYSGPFILWCVDTPE